VGGRNRRFAERARRLMPYGQSFLRRLRAMGIRDRPTAARSPWQNGYAERLIGSIRRDCLDHVVVFSERHLRVLLKSYQQYYNEARTHLSLQKDAPIPRASRPLVRHWRCQFWAGYTINISELEFPIRTGLVTANGRHSFHISLCTRMSVADGS
jgi:hypothetical protein